MLYNLELSQMFTECVLQKKGSMGQKHIGLFILYTV